MRHFFKWLGIGLLTLICLILLAAGGLLGWMKWAGDRDWKRVQAELQAKGEKLTFAELIPPPPPDDQNFFADPLWMQLTDLVPVKNKNEEGVEVTSWEPRLPAKELLINQGNTPLTNTEKMRLKAFLPKSEEAYPPDRSDFRLLNRELRTTTDPVRRKLFAQLILDLMQPASPMLAKITELSKRPSAYFPLRYQDIDKGAIIGCHNEVLKLGQLLNTKCMAELILNNVEAAFTDIHSLASLASAQGSQPLLIYHLIRLSVVSMALNNINVGIELHQWTDAQLAGFQTMLKKNDLADDLCFTLRGERIFANHMDYSTSVGHSPMGIFFNLVLSYSKPAHSSLMQDAIEKLQSNKSTGVNVTTSLFEQRLKEIHADPLKNLLYHMETLALPTLYGAIEKTIEVQTQIYQTIIACALERFRIAHGFYPASLDALIPEYLVAIPKEPTTGEPMHYRLEPEGKFLLWAPGWNLKTLGGKRGEFKRDGDIVWNQKLPTQSRETAKP